MIANRPEVPPQDQHETAQLAWLTPESALWALIGVSCLLRLVFAASLGVGNDEAYTSLFFRHPAWSYFDHPPMVAVVEALGLSLAPGHPTAFLLRLGFVLLFAGSTWQMARLAGRLYGPWAGVLAAFALNVTAYFGTITGTLALPDGPLLFFWLLTLDRLTLALKTPGRALLWLAAGLAWGGALLSKYHAFLLPVGFLCFLALEPAARACLRRVGPYLAAATGLLCFTPVIWWNAHHAWASFAFQGSRVNGAHRFCGDSLLQAVVGQAVYLLPWMWVLLVGVLVRRGRRLFARATATERFLLCQALPPLLLFMAVACSHRILPHWPLIGMVALMPMLGHSWAVQLQADPGRCRRKLALLAILPIALSALIVAQCRWGVLRMLSPAKDPTVDMLVWNQVAGGLRQRGLLGLPKTFLFTTDWAASGQLAFATGLTAPVLCYRQGDARGFAYWSTPERWLGCNGILVSRADKPDETAALRPWFTRIEDLGEVPVIRGGRVVRTMRLSRCVRETRPFPFAETPPTP